MKVGIIVIIVIGFVLIPSTLLFFYWKESNTIRIRATTTTSLYATGLLEFLASEFEKTHPNVRIDFVPLGSGEALRRAEMGDACLVFSHAPPLEKKYIEKNVITMGRIFAYNYFIIVGPEEDPAGVENAKNAIEAFKLIYMAGEKGKAIFISRGDSSGTHVRELELWRKTGLNPKGKPWYRETGQGMAETLVIASETRGYTLSDIGTFLKLKKEKRIPGLVALYTNSTELINVYSVYLVSSCSGRERSLALEFEKFIIENQNLIAYYGVKDYGSPLFYPARDRLEYLERIWNLLAGG